MQTEQSRFWEGTFGADYTDRNTFSPEELNQLYKTRYGTNRDEMTDMFLGGLGIAKILEVGCNVGNQLRHFQKKGYQQLFGIELQQYAVERAKQITSGIQIIQGSAFDIPFKDRYFDLAYTFGVLIHISPDDLELAMGEIYRTSNKYIYGFEYYSDNVRELEYRGHASKMWKANYREIYQSFFPDLVLVKEHFFSYKSQPELVDHMFLLEKKV